MVTIICENMFTNFIFYTKTPDGNYICENMFTNFFRYFFCIFKFKIYFLLFLIQKSLKFNKLPMFIKICSLIF